MNKVKWSHSALKDFEGCARRYHEIKVLKNYPITDTEQMRYGKELHKAAELYIKENVPFPEHFAFMQPILSALLTKPGRRFAEHEMALTENLTPCGFKADEVWVRGIVDLLIVDDDNLTAWVVDYKTGNNKYPDVGQLELMSLLVFANFPHIRQVNSALLFVVKESMNKFKMNVDEVPAAWQKYRERVAKLTACHANNVWNPNQTPLCGWCPVRSCEFNPKH